MWVLPRIESLVVTSQLLQMIITIYEPACRLAFGITIKFDSYLSFLFLLFSRLDRVALTITQESHLLGESISFSDQKEINPDEPRKSVLLVVFKFRIFDLSIFDKSKTRIYLSRRFLGDGKFIFLTWTSTWNFVGLNFGGSDDVD